MREDKMDSVQLSRVMLDRQLAASQVHLVRATSLPRYRQAEGGMKQFLKTARAIQRLPSFAKGRR